MSDQGVRYEVLTDKGASFGWLEVSNGCSEGHWVFASRFMEYDALDLFPKAPYGTEECCQAIVEAMGSGSWSVVPWVRAFGPMVAHASVSC